MSPAEIIQAFYDGMSVPSLAEDAYPGMRDTEAEQLVEAHVRGYIIGLRLALPDAEGDDA